MRKAGNIIKNIITIALIVIAAAVMVFTIVSVTTFDRSERSIFGYQAYIVQSDSMSATDFSAGDLILVKEADPFTLAEGDIISFISENDVNYGEVVTHKIRAVTTDANGNLGFVTYGTTTDTNDEAIVSYDDILGKYEKTIPKVGTFFAFLKTVPGYVLCILVPFLLIILIQGINCIGLFRQYKKEQMQEIENERKKMESERKASAEMMKELLALKEQLAKSGGSQSPNDGDF